MGQLQKKKLLGLCLFCALWPLILKDPCIVKAEGKLTLSGGWLLCVTDAGEEENNVKEPEKIQPQGLYSYASCLLDGENDRVLFEKHGNEPLPMASTTKIMTLIVILEHASMDDVVTVSKNAAAQPDVQLNIRSGEQYRLGDLVYSLMLESHNDVAVALAEHVGGSVEGFCALMNAKAAAMGLVDTCFETPNGLDADNHHTTAVELSKIASYAIKNPEFIKITNTSSYQFNELTTNRSFTVTNKNRFLYMMDGAIGVKTGFTGKAGYCFVGALKRGEHTLIATMLACGWPPNKNYKWSDTKKLMEYGLNHFRRTSFLERAEFFVNGEEVLSGEFDPENEKITIPVTGGVADSVAAASEGLLPKPLLLAEWEQPCIEVSYRTQLTAPVGEGEVVGSVTYLIDGEEYASCFIRTLEEVPKIDFWYCLRFVISRWNGGAL
ncbi:MAG: D-alanyl-D-alanine carboxypeptidase [Lachnospiraceae bacterium]|nr:D-alanyl-D-alanine carboxypeptidase [Lachnospiraceae bacterium]